MLIYRFQIVILVAVRVVLRLIVVCVGELAAKPVDYVLRRYQVRIHKALILSPVLEGLALVDYHLLHYIDFCYDARISKR